jgi:hypothetical protein
VKRHGVDPFSLVFGAMFALLGLTFLFTRVDVASLHLEWVWPIPLIVMGALIIFLAARPGRRDEERDRD